MNEDLCLLLARQTLGDIAEAGVEDARVDDVLGRWGPPGYARWGCGAEEVAGRFVVRVGVRVLRCHCLVVVVRRLSGGRPSRNASFKLQIREGGGGGGGSWTSVLNRNGDVVYSTLGSLVLVVRAVGGNG